MSDKNKPSMLGAAMKAAKANQSEGKQASQTASKPANQIESKPEDKQVNLCVRVPESQRRWWASQAKLQGKAMTEVIKAALAAEFGEPPG